jgi:hypothetical protein
MSLVAELECMLWVVGMEEAWLGKIQSIVLHLLILCLMRSLGL